MSVGLILSLGFLLLVSLVISAALTALERLSRGEMLVNTVLTWINFLFAFVLVAALFATIYKVLPSVKIAWRDVTIGSLVTAFLFTLGKFAIGVYIGNSGVASTYGAAGSVVLILIWVYYSAQILLYGAEFTHAFAYKYGSYARNPGPGSHFLKCPVAGTVAGNGTCPRGKKNSKRRCVLPDLDLVPMRTGRRKLDVAICLLLLLAAAVCVWSVSGIGGHIQTLIDAGRTTSGLKPT